MPAAALTVPGMNGFPVDAIFSQTRKAGCTREVKTWGDLGLGGAWADREIDVYGRNAASGTDSRDGQTKPGLPGDVPVTAVTAKKQLACESRRPPAPLLQTGPAASETGSMRCILPLMLLAACYDPVDVANDSPVVADTRVFRARMELRQRQAEADQHHALRGEWPEECGRDPWGRAYVLDLDAEPPTVFSLGPDGEAGTDDDVYAR